MSAAARGQLAALTEDVVKTSAIEGESRTWRQSGRRSRAGSVDIGALAPVDRHVEGVVDMVLDATAHAAAPVTDARLFGWHAALFPTGYSGMSRITVGGWRTDATGPMQVVSGPIGRQRVHFEGRRRAPRRRDRALSRGSMPSRSVLLIRPASPIWVRHAPSVRRRQRPDCACARGSGLARADRSPQRLQPVGANPARAQRLLRRAGADAARLARRHGMARVVPDRARQGHRPRAHDARRGAGQGALLAALRGLRDERAPGEGHESPARRLRGEADHHQWAALAKCSQDTALRDITELVEHGVRRSSSGGRSTSYELMPFSG